MWIGLEICFGGLQSQERHEFQWLTRCSTNRKANRLPCHSGLSYLLNITPTNPFQDPTSAPTPTTLADLNTTATSLQTETTSLRAREKALKASLATLTSTPSTGDLQRGVSALEREKADLEARLGPLRAGTTALVSKKEMETVEGEVKRWERVEARRRRIREEMWAVVRDVLPEGTDVGDVMVSFCCLVGFVVDVVCFA